MPSCLQSWGVGVGNEHDAIFWASGLNFILHTRKPCTLGVTLPLLTEWTVHLSLALCVYSLWNLLKRGRGRNKGMKARIVH